MLMRVCVKAGYHTISHIFGLRTSWFWYHCINEINFILINLYEYACCLLPRAIGAPTTAPVPTATGKA